MRVVYCIYITIYTDMKATYIHNQYYLSNNITYIHTHTCPTLSHTCPTYVLKLNPIPYKLYPYRTLLLFSRPPYWEIQVVLLGLQRSYLPRGVCPSIALSAIKIIINVLYQLENKIKRNYIMNVVYILWNPFEVTWSLRMCGWTHRRSNHINCCPFPDTNTVKRDKL